MTDKEKYLSAPSRSLSINKKDWAIAIANKYGNFESFLRTFAPQGQYKITSAEIAYRCDVPTLVRIDEVYGKGSAAKWLTIQLADLVAYSGLPADSVSMLPPVAQTIRARFYDWKVTEIMFFFLQFKGGQYGHFYSRFSPLVVTEALTEYNKQRVEAIDRVESQKTLKEQLSSGQPISYEEYVKIKAAKGESVQSKNLSDAVSEFLKDMEV